MNNLVARVLPRSPSFDNNDTQALHDNFNLQSGERLTSKPSHATIKCNIQTLQSNSFRNYKPSYKIK